jgi:hypothetical protein
MVTGDLLDCDVEAKSREKAFHRKGREVFAKVAEEIRVGQRVDEAAAAAGRAR